MSPSFATNLYCRSSYSQVPTLFILYAVFVAPLSAPCSVIDTMSASTNTSHPRASSQSSPLNLAARGVDSEVLNVYNCECDTAEFALPLLADRESHTVSE